MADNSLGLLASPTVTAALVFVVVALTMAVVLYRMLYARSSDKARPRAAPVQAPPPANTPCPQCGQQTAAGTICTCGFNLASLQFSTPPPLPPADSDVPQPPRNPWGITDEASARAVARQGMWAAFFVAIVTGAVAFLAGMGITLVKGIGPLAWLDAAIFTALGFGIRNMSRAAAVGALVLFVAERIVMAQSAGVNPAMAIGVVLAFVQGIRGTFAFQKHRQAVGYTASDGSLAPQ